MLRDIRHCSTQFVLFGASGDLSRRLIVPALFNLHLDGQLPQTFTLWGLGQREWQASRNIHGAAPLEMTNGTPSPPISVICAPT